MCVDLGKKLSSNALPLPVMARGKYEPVGVVVGAVAARQTEGVAVFESKDRVNVRCGPKCKQQTQTPVRLQSSHAAVRRRPPTGLELQTSASPPSLQPTNSVAFRSSRGAAVLGQASRHPGVQTFRQAGIQASEQAGIQASRHPFRSRHLFYFCPFKREAKGRESERDHK